MTNVCLPNDDGWNAGTRARWPLALCCARLLFSLPAPIQVALSGRRPVRIDGNVLDPQMQLLLAAQRLRRGATLRAETPAKARAEMRRDALRCTRPPSAADRSRDVTIPGPAGPLPARLYMCRESPGPLPLLVYFHGGGFVCGGLETHDGPCRLLCRRAGVHVLSIDYRLAPEHPFPAAVDDARAALRWAQKHATALDADPQRIAIGGDSAGGNLAAVVSQLAATDGGPPPAMQLLMYPAVDRITERPALTLFGAGFVLTRDDIDWCDRHYVGASRQLLADPRVSPLLARDLSGLCPALVVTAGFDPLRDEGEAYAAALTAAGNTAIVRRMGGLLHGFANLVDVSPAARDAVVCVAELLRGMSRASGRSVATTEGPATTLPQGPCEDQRPCS